MSLLIKGMDMPKACEWCSFISTFTTEYGMGCRCEVGKFEFCDYTKRQEKCPLVEFPTPHGRLIDADALPLKDIDNSNYPSNYIKAAPAVIEAEGE